MMIHRKCAVYARQSIDKADSISIETQIERCLIEVGNAPFQIFADRGYSGKNTDRPQFQQMLGAVCNGEIRSVICYKLDRCSRSILDFTRLMDLFQRHDVVFISCTEKFDTATPMGRAMLNICIVFAQLERETIQERITDAYHSRCKKGYFMGGRVPFGFSLEPCWLDGKKTSRYRAVDAEAEILKHIYSIYKDPSTSLSDVVHCLETIGISNPRRSDGLWVRPHIARMIKNPIYAMADEQIYDYYVQMNVLPDNPRTDYIGQNGCYLYNIGNERHLVLAPHKGIIPPDLWLKCQKHRQIAHHSERGKLPISWLTGKLICQKCGRAVVTRQTVGRNNRIYRYFLCSASRGKGRICSGFKPFPGEITETAIGNAIYQRVRKLSSSECIRTNSETLLQKIQSCIENSPNITDASAVQLKSILHQLCSGLPLQTDSVFINLPEEQAQFSRLLDHLSHWDDIPTEKKMRIAQLMIETVKLTDNRITILWRF